MTDSTLRGGQPVPAMWPPPRPASPTSLQIVEPPVKAPPPAAVCPEATRHTPQPASYLGHGAWADQMLLTHSQRRCSGCNTWAIWEPKPGAAATPAVADGECSRCGAYYPEGALIRTDGNSGWIASACCPPLLALTVRPPWSHAIAALGKTIENRTWKTGHRGPLAIHASSTWDGQQSARSVAEISGVQVGKPDHGAAVVAVADLVGMHQSLTCLRPIPDRHVHPDGSFMCSPWAVGLGELLWHWELANVRRLDVPVACAGRLRLWELPAEVERAVLAQIGVVS